MDSELEKFSHTLRFELDKSRHGQTDSVQGVCKYGFDPLSRPGIITMRIGQKNSSEAES